MDLPPATRMHTTTPICKRSTSWRQSPIPYSDETLTSVHRRDGSYFYSNPNGSTYYNDGRANAVYKPGNQGSYLDGTLARINEEVRCLLRQRALLSLEALCLDDLRLRADDGSIEVQRASCLTFAPPCLWGLGGRG